MSTITPEQQTAIASKLATMHLPSGLGDEQSACSIAAINLALSGRLTDEIPDCMSEVIGQWIISVQDAMPDAVRNSARWKSLLPLAAGTGRVNEQERLKIILDWMWGTVLPSLQSLAGQQGFGAQWKKMTTKRTAEAATAAVAEAARVARAASRAAGATEATWAATWAGAAAARVAAARAAGMAAGMAARATREAGAAAEVAEVARAEAWADFDPCELLERLIRIGNNTQGVA
jgi:hypothetical protein